MSKEIITTFQVKRGTSDKWAEINPVLKQGEPGFEIDTGKLRIGDGITPANELPTFIPGEQTGGVGEASIEGGEIFNDYETNKAISKYSHAEGSNNIVGARAFNIIGKFSSARGNGYELDSIEGLEIGDTYSVKFDHNYNNIGTIVSIDTTYCEVYVDGEFPADDLVRDESGDPIRSTQSNSFIVSSKPTIGTKDIGQGAHAEGWGNAAVRDYAHAEGVANKVYGRYGHAEGNGNEVGHSAHGEGSGNTALGDYSHAEGYHTSSQGNYSHGEGHSTQAIGNGSHAEGRQTIAKGSHSHAEGEGTSADAQWAHSEGYKSNATGNGSHSEGRETAASGIAAHAEGYNTKAFGNYSHTEGSNTEATLNAHAEGTGTHALANGAHAEGSNTTAKGGFSHAEGEETLAQGGRAHAEGLKTKATGDYSHAEGQGTIASGNVQHVQGRYNISDGSKAHIVGNGTADNARSNAHTLDWNGNAWFAGTVETTGIILTSPNGTKFKLIVSDDGTLSTTQI